MTVDGEDEHRLCRGVDKSEQVSFPFSEGCGECSSFEVGSLFEAMGIRFAGIWCSIDRSITWRATVSIKIAAEICTLSIVSDRATS